MRVELAYVFFDVALFKIEVHLVSSQVLLNVFEGGKDLSGTRQNGDGSISLQIKESILRL